MWLALSVQEARRQKGEGGFCLFVCLFNRTQQGLLTCYNSLSPQRSITSTLTPEVMVVGTGRQRWGSSSALCGLLSPLTGNLVRWGTFCLAALLPRQRPVGCICLHLPSWQDHTPHILISKRKRGPKERKPVVVFRSPGVTTEAFGIHVQGNMGEP